MLGNGAVILSVHRGTVSVKKSQEESVLVKAGDQLTVNRQAAMKDDTPGTAAHGSSTMGQKMSAFHLSHGASVALIGVAVVATAAAIAIPLATNNETPASPSAP